LSTVITARSDNGLAPRLAWLALRLLPFAAIIFLWDSASRAFDVPVLFPGPLSTWHKAVQLVAEGQLQADILISLWRIAVGFVLGTLLGMTLGLMMGISRPIADTLSPFVHTLRFIGPIAWISAVMMWFGLGETSKVILIIYTTTFVVLISTMIGVMTIHPNKLRAARVFGARGFRLFAHVTLPAALPHVLTGARLAMMNSFMTIIAAEMVAAREGLGFLIFNSRQWMEVDAIFVGMITLGLLGLLADQLLVLLTRLLFRRFRPADA
jgi:ABC-type nitrate/sulfonate/bicarbonate transport system permease component